MPKNCANSTWKSLMSNHTHRLATGLAWQDILMNCFSYSHKKLLLLISISIIGMIYFEMPGSFSVDFDAQQSKDNYIFILGYGRSGTSEFYFQSALFIKVAFYYAYFEGTTLIRAILDAHPDVLCGQETIIIPSFLVWMTEWRNQWHSTPALITEIYNTGLSSSTHDTAARQYIKVVIENRFRKSKRYCTKDPMNSHFILDLKRYFPNAKFILMMRDVRGVALFPRR